MDVAGGEVGEVLLNGGERPVAFARHESVGAGDGLLHGFGVQPPQLQRVVHSTRYDAFAF